MARPAHRRPNLPRPSLIAWLAWMAFVVAASALPFFVEARLWAPGGRGYWGCKHGSVFGARVNRPTVDALLGEDRSILRWNPGATASIAFDWGPSPDVEPRPNRRSRPFVRRAPPWAVLLMPTLLVIVLARPARFLAPRLSRWLARGLARVGDWPSPERRALLAAGRVPCPSCDYDVTGLDRCPECGTPSRAVRQRRIRPARLWRLALVVWLGIAGTASLMPFLFFVDLEFNRLSLGLVNGSVYVFYDANVSPYGSSRAPTMYWRPGLLHMFTFDAGWTPGFRYVQFPPWLVLLVPTLVAMTIRRERRYYKRRRLRRQGRTLCPACQYDATGLEVCPECGAAITARAEHTNG